MLIAQRHYEILNRLNSQSVIKTDVLAKDLKVSAETIRRDLLQLENEQKLVRVHGGAAKLNDHYISIEDNYYKRQKTNINSKNSIAKNSIQILPEDNSTIIIDIGTTMEHLALEIIKTFKGTVITASLSVAQILCQSKKIKVILAGGTINPNNISTFGQGTHEFFNNVYADVAFISCGGVSISAGVTDYDYEDSMVKRKIIANSVKKYVLAGSTKFGAISPYKITDLNEINGIVTNEKAEDNFHSYCEAKNIELIHTKKKILSE